MTTLYDRVKAGLVDKDLRQVCEDSGKKAQEIAKCVATIKECGVRVANHMTFVDGEFTAPPEKIVQASQCITEKLR